MPHVTQKLIDCGLNAFAAQLLAESLLRHPKPVKVEFGLPIRRSDCEGWAGVRFVLEPLSEAEEIPPDHDDTPIGENVLLEMGFAEHPDDHLVFDWVLKTQGSWVLFLRIDLRAKDAQLMHSNDPDEANGLTIPKFPETVGQLNTLVAALGGRV